MRNGRHKWKVTRSVTKAAIVLPKTPPRVGQHKRVLCFGDDEAAAPHDGSGEPSQQFSEPVHVDQLAPYPPEGDSFTQKHPPEVDALAAVDGVPTWS